MTLALLRSHFAAKLPLWCCDDYFRADELYGEDPALAATAVIEEAQQRELTAHSLGRTPSTDPFYLPLVLFEEKVKRAKPRKTGIARAVERSATVAQSTAKPSRLGEEFRPGYRTVPVPVPVPALGGLARYWKAQNAFAAKHRDLLCRAEAIVGIPLALEHVDDLWVVAVGRDGSCRTWTRGGLERAR